MERRRAREVLIGLEVAGIVPMAFEDGSMRSLESGRLVIMTTATGKRGSSPKSDTTGTDEDVKSQDAGTEERPAFFRWKGFIKTGPSALEAIRKARRERGRL